MNLGWVVGPMIGGYAAVVSGDYSLAAWLLYRNELLPEDVVLDAATLPGVRMPAHDRFVADDRTGGTIVR